MSHHFTGNNGVIAPTPVEKYNQKLNFKKLFVSKFYLKNSCYLIFIVFDFRDCRKRDKFSKLKKIL